MKKASIALLLLGVTLSEAATKKFTPHPEVSHEKKQQIIANKHARADAEKKLHHKGEEVERTVKHADLHYTNHRNYNEAAAILDEMAHIEPGTHDWHVELASVMNKMTKERSAELHGKDYPDHDPDSEWADLTEDELDEMLDIRRQKMHRAHQAKVDAKAVEVAKAIERAHDLEGIHEDDLTDEENIHRNALLKKKKVQEDTHQSIAGGAHPVEVMYYNHVAEHGLRHAIEHDHIKEERLELHKMRREVREDEHREYTEMLDGYIPNIHAIDHHKEAARVNQDHKDHVKRKIKQAHTHVDTYDYEHEDHVNAKKEREAEHQAFWDVQAAKEQARVDALPKKNVDVHPDWNVRSTGDGVHYSMQYGPKASRGPKGPKGHPLHHETEFEDLRHKEEWVGPVDPDYLKTHHKLNKPVVPKDNRKNSKAKKARDGIHETYRLDENKEAKREVHNEDIRKMADEHYPHLKLTFEELEEANRKVLKLLKPNKRSARPADAPKPNKDEL